MDGLDDSVKASLVLMHMLTLLPCLYSHWVDIVDTNCAVHIITSFTVIHNFFLCTLDSPKDICSTCALHHLSGINANYHHFSYNRILSDNNDNDSYHHHGVVSCHPHYTYHQQMDNYARQSLWCQHDISTMAMAIITSQWHDVESSHDHAGSSTTSTLQGSRCCCSNKWQCICIDCVDIWINIHNMWFGYAFIVK